MNLTKNKNTKKLFVISLLFLSSLSFAQTAEEVIKYKCEDLASGMEAALAIKVMPAGGSKWLLDSVSVTYSPSGNGTETIKLEEDEVYDSKLDAITVVDKGAAGGVAYARVVSNAKTKKIEKIIHFSSGRNQLLIQHIGFEKDSDNSEFFYPNCKKL